MLHQIWWMIFLSWISNRVLSAMVWSNETRCHLTKLPISVTYNKKKKSESWLLSRERLITLKKMDTSSPPHTNAIIPGGQKKKTEQSIFFLGLCSNQQLSFYTLLDRASFSHSHYNNTKIIKFGWIFFLWVISYGLSFSRFAISLSLIVPRNSGNRANPEKWQSIRNYS